MADVESPSNSLGVRRVLKLPSDSLGVCRVGLITRVLVDVVQILGDDGNSQSRVAQCGVHVSCVLGPPCKVKSDRFAMTCGHESLDLFVTS